VAVERLGDKVPRIAVSAWVHAAATVIGDVEIGEHSSVWPGAVLRADFGPIRIGARTSIQDNTVIHASERGTRIGDRCIVGHVAFLEDADVGDECQIGVGARVLTGAVVEPGAVVAAGAVVVGGLRVPSGRRAQGVPATIVAGGRPTRAEIAAGAELYVAMARTHATASA
jgi:carbonic anhydrase/acetyltransferase-like protein (isoleucine patch superfamily)